MYCKPPMLLVAFGCRAKLCASLSFSICSFVLRVSVLSTHSSFPPPEWCRQWPHPGLWSVLRCLCCLARWSTITALLSPTATIPSLLATFFNTFILLSSISVSYLAVSYTILFVSGKFWGTMGSTIKRAQPMLFSHLYSSPLFLSYLI